MTEILGNVTYQRTVFSDDQKNARADGKTPEYFRSRFKQFIRHFHLDNVFLYRDQLRHHYNLHKYYINVRIDHLRAFDEELVQKLIQEPASMVPLFEIGAKEAVHALNLHRFVDNYKDSDTNRPIQNSQDTQTNFEDLDSVGSETNLNHLNDIQDIQVTFSWNANPVHIRDLQSEHVSRLVCVSGIVINASRTSSKCSLAHIQCATCKIEKVIPVKAGFSGITIPSRCDTIPIAGKQPCRPGSYVVISDKCEFVDQQTLKLQESPETVPTGEMPRNLILSVDRYLVERTPPGTRVTVVGIFSTFQNGKQRRSGKSNSTISNPYIRVLGIDVSRQGSGRSDMQFTAKEEEEFKRLARSPDLCKLMVNSMDPAIYGHQDIKKALACQLLGGSSKTMNDGIRRRGDINVLLLGDPSTAKSQLLKFVEKVAPIGVYTSGKGSSAAGLTACVIKEPGSGEFYLEGGSMVLADGGIVCIDEFDKMRDQDRVAIHEAMEQQTISIAKAGITTVLNSRTAVLAAANPLFGRYDDMKTAEEQIDFQTTILSRFDMIFIVKDVRDPKRDERIARHVLGIHQNKKQVRNVANGGELDTEFMKRYIAYCRSVCSPRLSSEASECLMSFYVNQRSEQGRDSSHSNMPTIPITVRQLEALVRMSESLAKMELSTVANISHAEQAIQLFTGSTIEAIKSGKVNMNLSMSAEDLVEVEKAEERIKSKVPFGAHINVEKLIAMMGMLNHNRYIVDRAIFIMVQRGELEHRDQRRSVVRKK
ncbi:DNA replication licensing factor MCM5 [Acrasis kona]|uniref:DNA replication licensing factor MCM5 n=1 Tax=Acrasis kona TaxID=1008807 RepID=A0AAW2YX77_9EUKA